MRIKMMTTKNVIPEGAEDDFRALLGTVQTDEQPGTYKWQKMPGGRFRARCSGHKALMTWAMRMDPRYGITQNKYTERNGAHVVDYRGRPIQMWFCEKCKAEGIDNWVVK